MVRAKPICFKEDSDFRFVSFVGFGKDTPLHAVFTRPVARLPEILHQTPEYVCADGDGTVLTTSALADGYPEFVVQNRICVNNAEHFGIMSEMKLFEIIVNELQLEKRLK